MATCPKNVESRDDWLELGNRGGWHTHYRTRAGGQGAYEWYSCRLQLFETLSATLYSLENETALGHALRSPRGFY